MRLLERNRAGELSLTRDFVGDNIPEYAILSHTWGADTDEVTFRDLIDGTGKSKAGYDKIRFCAQQAAKDGLQFFWVDTCCIDKSNNVELQEAINSMFRWYRNAAKCYVYLSDVSILAFDKSYQLSWELAFRQSRWFTRGWTLQDLLAPDLVEFFSREGERLGDKKTLERQVHEITGIPVSALQGAPLSQFGVDERFSWVENRQTTREEDEAYSLLGIFGVYMPLIYGEGRENAFKRLREEIDKPSKGLNRGLDRLPYAAGAPFNSSENQHSPTCLPDTRVELLREIYDWADGHNTCCIFWLNGLVGTGKSTISRTVARKWYQERRLGASFFFSRGGGDVGHAGKFVTSIAVQLASSIPAIYRFICDAITEHSDIASRSFRDQWQLLILDPLLKLEGNGNRASYILVVDALDECEDDNSIRIILQLLAEARLSKKIRLRIFLTSRPEVPIRYGFSQMSKTEHQDFILHNISPSIVNHDIEIFLRYNLELIASELTLDASWPGEQAFRQLVLNASGLFIWAATACRFIREGKRFANKRLALILQNDASVTLLERYINEIYTTVLKHSVSSEYTDEEREELFAMLRLTLGSIVVLLSPLSTYSLNRLLDLPRRTVGQTLHGFHAILDIPEDQTRPLRLHHPSFRHFLINKDRCGDSSFWIDEKQAHQILAERCIRLMSNSLKQDICGQEAPSTLVADVEISRIEQCLPPEIRYACLYWAQHLQQSGAQLCDEDQVHQFLQVHLLHWLEALSWIGKTSEAILAILSLEALTPAYKSPILHAFVYDAKRFALYNRSFIEQAPLEIYSSMLFSAPMKSIVRKQFENHIPRRMQTSPELPRDWSSLLQTLKGHSNVVSAVTFSPDGKQLASGSSDKTMRLWDAATGAALQSLEGHTGGVTAVVFSPDGMHLASASRDKTVRLWDAAMGAALQSFEGHTGGVTAVVFSPDGMHLASASRDKTVRLWVAVTGAALQTLEGHSNVVSAVAFSPVGRQLASASADMTVKLWDTATGAALQTLEGHSNAVSAVAFSLDGRQLASASADRTVKLWDPATGAALQTLEGHSNAVNAVAFSPDGRQLASASEDNTINLWDPTMLPLAQTLERASEHSYLKDQRFIDEGLPALERDGSKESIEPRVKPQGPFSDSGYASMLSSASPSTSNDNYQASIYVNQNMKQLVVSIGDQKDNQSPENDHSLGFEKPEAADVDLQSVVSDRDEISSQISTRKTQQELLAERHLSGLLAEHEELKPLYEIALERMEKEHFVNNFRRILKRYYLDLLQSANTNLERATVHLLRSRWSRLRMAQDIVDRVSPESVELYAQLLDATRDIEDKIPILESWIAGNPGLAPPLEPQDIGDEVEVKLDGLDDSASDDEEDQEVRNYLLPNVAEMESFLLQGNSFRLLLTNICLFLLPAALTPFSRVLMTIPYDRIYFSSEDNISILNRVKGFVEDHTEENWNWWPLQPRMRPLAKDQTRVYWKCHCGSMQWAEISLSQAESYRLILQRNRSALQNNHLCKTRRKISWRATLKEIVTKIVGHVSTRTQPLTTRGITQPLGPQNIQLKASDGGARQAANIFHNPAGPATINQSGVQVNIGELPRADVYVLFGVKGPRRTLELEQIEVKENSDDTAFFQGLTQAYRKHRGFWRYWFSIWQLTHCDFVKFIKLKANRIIRHSKSLPEDITYEYRPRPPAAENPPILPHEFELAFSACSSKCPFSAIHDCVEPPSGTFAVERIPKRKSRIEIYSNNLEYAWGIQAQHSISFLKMVLYHVLIFASTFGFWAWWLLTHPNDLQNAAVPLTTVAVFLSLFWSSAGVLKVFREQD